MNKKKRPPGFKKKARSPSAKSKTKVSKQTSLTLKVKKVRVPRPKDVPELQARRADISKSLRAKAARGLNCRAAATDDDRAILECLTGEKDWLSEPIASNLAHRDKLAELMSSMMLAKRAESPSLQVGLVTLISQEWETSMESTEIDVCRVMTETRGALNKMAPHSLSVVDFQGFNNVTHERGGALLSPHTHSLIFGSDIKERAEAATKKVQWGFRPRFDGVDGVRLSWVGDDEMDLVRAAYYLNKVSDRCKSLYKNADTGKANLHASEANDRFIRYLRTVHILSMIRTDRIMFGSGQGGSIRGDILREANSVLRSGDKDRHPPFHSEGIAAYLIDLMDRISEPRFKLPIIKYRKK